MTRGGGRSARAPRAARSDQSGAGNASKIERASSSDSFAAAFCFARRWRRPSTSSVRARSNGHRSSGSSTSSGADASSALTPRCDRHAPRAVDRGGLAFEPVDEARSVVDVTGCDERLERVAARRVRREAEPRRVDPVEQRLEVRQRGRVVAERELEEAEHADVHHARVLLLRGRGERRAELGELARLVDAAEVRCGERLPVDGQAAVVLEADLLGELVRLVGLRRTPPSSLPSAARRRRGGRGLRAPRSRRRTRRPPRAACRRARAPRRAAPGTCEGARAACAGCGS